MPIGLIETYYDYYSYFHRNSSYFRGRQAAHDMLSLTRIASAWTDAPRLRQRLAIASRTILAIFGGYAFAALATASLALALPLTRPQAVLAATLSSFALYCALVIWAFAAASATRAWLVAGALCCLPAAHLLLTGARP